MRLHRQRNTGAPPRAHLSDRRTKRKPTSTSRRTKHTEASTKDKEPASKRAWLSCKRELALPPLAMNNEPVRSLVNLNFFRDAFLWLGSAFARNRLLIRGSVIKCACVSQIITRVTHPAKKKRRVRVVLLHTTNILTNIHTYILTNILTYKHTYILTNILQTY